MSRTEQDFLGQREIGDDIYYGVQTIRGKENFHITGIPMSQEPYFVKALRLREEGRRDGQSRSRRAGRQDRRRDHRRLRPRHCRRHDGPVRHRLHPGRRRHLDQHERQRGDRQPRAGIARLPKGEYQQVSPNDHVNYGQSTNDTYPTAFRLGADPAARELHDGAAPAAGRLLRQGQGVRRRAEDGPHPPAGRGADVARRRIPRLGHDDRRGGRPHRRGARAAARDQSRRHRDRHLGDRRARLSRARGEASHRR